MSDVKEIKFEIGDHAVSLLNGLRYEVRHIQKGKAGTPEGEAVYWLATVGRIPTERRELVSVPASLTGEYYRKVSKRPVIGGNE